jgi:hypothetical protein
LPVSEPSVGAAWTSWGHDVSTIVNSVETADARLDALEAGSGGVTSVTAANSTITVAGTGANPTVAVNAITESQVTNLTTDLAARLVKASNLSDLASAATARSNLGLSAIAASGSAADLAAGKVPLARLGASGTASTATFLRGDNTWAVPGPAGALNVMAYGATGNGATDDRAAIQAAIDAAGAQGSVFIPPGIFVIGGALTVAHTGVTIMGAGYRATWLYLQNSSNSSMIATADDGVQRQGLLVTGLALIGNADNQTGSSPAIAIRGMDEAILDQLYILEPRGEAIRTGQATPVVTCTVPIIHGCVIRGDVATSQSGGITLDTGSSDAIVSNCDIGFFPLGAGVLLSDHAGASLTNNNVWQCRFGYWNFSAHRTRYVNCLSDYANEHGFRVDTSNDLQYANCQARESSQTTTNTYDGFYFAGANDLSLSNCRAMGSTTRVGITLASNVVRARIVGGNATGNVTAPHVIGTGCSDYQFNNVVGIPNGGSVTALTDGATVNLDASAGRLFTLTAAGNRTIAAPTGAGFDGQELVIAHTASGGSRTLALTTGSTGAFAFGTTITALSATTSGTTDYITCTYSTAAQRWRVVQYVKGF